MAGQANADVPIGCCDYVAQHNVAVLLKPLPTLLAELSILEFLPTRQQLPDIHPSFFTFHITLI